MKLERRLVCARIIGRNLKHAIEDGDLDEARHAVFHLRRKLRQASVLLDQVEAMIEPPLDVFRNGRFVAPDDLP